jgi:hypothetical protein
MISTTAGPCSTQTLNSRRPIIAVHPVCVVVTEVSLPQVTSIKWLLYRLQEGTSTVAVFACSLCH